MPIDAVLARSIVESVGSSGTPPENGLAHFTVGLDPYVAAVRDEYLRTYIKQGGSAFKLVVGPFGGGKTHFLYVIRDAAWQEGFAVSYVALTPHETPFHSLHLVYKSLAAGLSLDAGTRGIEAALRRWFLDKQAEMKGDEECLRQVAEGVRGYESTSYAKALRGAFLALLEGREDEFELLVQYLKGEWEDADRSLLLKHGVAEPIHRASAGRMIRSLIQWVRGTGRGGLVVLFDEAELTPSFSRKQKEVLINNLRELIDRCCQASFGGAMVFYAVPDERTLEGRGTAYEALKQRLSTVFDVPNPTGIKIHLEKISKDHVGFLTEVGLRLAAVYEAAYGATFDQAQLVEALKALAAACHEERFSDISYKRLFVQAAVRLLHRVRQTGEYGVPVRELVKPA